MNIRKQFAVKILLTRDTQNITSDNDHVEESVVNPYFIKSDS